MDMDLDIRLEKDTIYFRVSGSIDTEGGAELTTKFMDYADNKEIKHAVFDLVEVASITSAGIGKLLKFFKHFDKLGGSMRIEGVSETLKQQFAEIHLDQIIPVK
jgi:anti-anti-sigma factor